MELYLHVFAVLPPFVRNGHCEKSFSNTNAAANNVAAAENREIHGNISERLRGVMCLH